MLNNLENNNVLLLVGRVLLALIYAAGTVSIFTNSVPVGFGAAGKLVAFPGWLVWLGFIVKAVAGIAIIVGFQTRLAALALAVFTVITAFNFHEIGGIVFMKELSMIGGLLLLAAVGPGAISIDKK